MAKATIKTSIIIKSDIHTIWNALIDFKNYGKWNPFLKDIEGDFKVGNQVKVIADGMKFKPVVLIYDEPKEIKWLGSLWIKGLFDGEHIFKLKDIGNGKVEFHHEENFNGILVRPLMYLIGNKTKENFEAMNLALKQFVEK